MATIYQTSDGQSVYDMGGNTIYASGPNAGKIYTPGTTTQNLSLAAPSNVSLSTTPTAVIPGNNNSAAMTPQTNVIPTTNSQNAVVPGNNNATTSLPNATSTNIGTSPVNTATLGLNSQIPQEYNIPDGAYVRVNGTVYSNQNGKLGPINPTATLDIGRAQDISSYAPAPPAQPTQQPVTAATPVGQSTTQTPAQAQQGQTGQPLTFNPAVNPSVVDLISSTGGDASFAARQALAARFGIQGYSGTAQENIELANDYVKAFNDLKGTKAPDNAAQAQTAVSTINQQNDPASNPTLAPARFYDAVGSMDPVVSSLYNQINQALSSPITTQSFADQYQQLIQQQGIPALQTQLMNIHALMDGTEDSIRQEIQNSGGTATENQIQALSSARNKVFLQQSSQLQQQLNLKEDYVSNIMAFSQADRADVEKQIDQKMGLTTQLVNLQDKMTNAAKDNYNQIIQNLGYAGLAAALKNDPQQRAQVEQLLGLGKGSLSDPAFLGQEDAGKVLGSASTGYFTYNPYTGETTPIATGGTSGGSVGGTGGQGGVAPQIGVPTLNGKPLNDTQSTTLGYVQRLNDSNKTISDIGGNFTGAFSTLGALLPNFLKSSDRQVYEQAQRNFINAVLRRESGAAISPSEFDSAAQQYFPQPGDSQAVVNQKTANRQRVISSLAQSANVPLSYVTGPQSSTGTYQDYLSAIQ